MTTHLRARDRLLYGPADFGGNLVGVVGTTWLLYSFVNVAGLLWLLPFAPDGRLSWPAWAS